MEEKPYKIDFELTKQQLLYLYDLLYRKECTEGHEEFSLKWSIYRALRKFMINNNISCWPAKREERRKALWQSKQVVDAKRKDVKQGTDQKRWPS